MARPHPLLLALSRNEPLPVPDDENALLSSAIDHRMTGCLLTAVHSGRLTLGHEATRRLLALDMAQAIHHRRLWSALEVATHRLSRAGIRSLTFKGVTDEQRWFSREGERPCSDVDIVVDDVDAFDEAIAALAPNHALLGAAADLARRGYLRAVDLDIDGVHVDLHVDPVKVGTGWRHPEVWLAHTSSLTTPGGAEVRVFDPEAVLALKLLHLGRDRFRELFGLVEAQRIVEDVHWPTVAHLAHLEGLEVPVTVAAEVVAHELHRRPWVQPLSGRRAQMWRKAWAPSVRLHGQEGRWRHIRRSQWLLPLSMPGRFIESVAWLLRSATPPRVLLELKHPEIRGPYLWQLTAGRITFLARRRWDARRDRA